MAGRHVENLLLVLGASAGNHAHWQRCATALAADAVLIVLPAEPGPQRDVLERIARTLETRGQQVTMVHALTRLECVLSDDDLAPRLQHVSVQLTFDLAMDDDLSSIPNQSHAVI